MRKIFSAALALVCIWFATPAHAALPSGYTELEYIESTGTQYIDTGFSPDANTRVDYKGQLLQYTSSVPLLGARLGSDNPGRFFPLAWSTNANTGRIAYGAKDVTLNISTSTIYTGTFIPVQEKTIINGITYDISGANFTKTADNNFYLFATSGYGSLLYNSVGRIWYVKIWDNDTLVRDFVPAKNSSGVVGMYDTVNNRFYTNAGTGEFIAGDPVTDNSCRNLFDKDAEYINAYVNANSGVLTRGDSQYSFVIPVQPNTKYTLSGMSSGSSWGSFADNSIGATATSKLAGNGTLTTGANDKYLIGLAYASGTQYDYRQTLQIEEGDVATEYVPYCEKIKIATTKYNESAFSPLNTALQNAISVVDSVVSNTITQAASIATLQTQKQTRPNDIADDNEKCPAGKKCLLVEDASGIPHWYEIVENAWDLPAGYTQLEYIKSTGTQYIDTGIIATNWDWSVEFEMSVPQAGDMFFGAGRGLWGSAEWGAQFGLANSSGNANWGFGSGGMNVVISNLGVRTNTFYNYKITKEGLYVNGELKSQNTATESFSNSNLSLWICKTNNPGTSGYNKAGSSWKYVRIYNADTALVFNGVPAKNPDGKIGMYDKVSGEFFENKGTGSFIAGPVAQ